MRKKGAFPLQKKENGPDWPRLLTVLPLISGSYVRRENSRKTFPVGCTMKLPHRTLQGITLGSGLASH